MAWARPLCCAASPDRRSLAPGRSLTGAVCASGSVRGAGRSRYLARSDHDRSDSARAAGGGAGNEFVENRPRAGHVGIARRDAGAELSELSGGWQRPTLIARVWVTDPDVLLLDEPTNHLDNQRLEVLENWINHATEGVAMVIASHDRQFLDGCTNRTLFLRQDESRLYAHPFSRARALLADDDAAREAKLARDTKEADRLRRGAGHLRNVGINSGSDVWLKKSKQLAGRAEAIEQSLRPLVPTRTGEIRLTNRGTHAKVLVALEDVPVATPDGTTLFRTGTMRIFQRDRIVVTGANGVGKSVFVRLPRRAMEGETIAGINVTPSVVTGYIDQQMSQLPSAETLLDFVAGRFRVGDQRGVSLLAGAGFDFDARRRPIAQLSPGQKARPGLLAPRLTEPNFYLMDEPTNHVDIAGQERLEAELLAHEATACWFRTTGSLSARSARGFFASRAGGSSRLRDLSQCRPDLREAGKIRGTLFHERGERFGRLGRGHVCAKQFQFFADAAWQVRLAAAHELFGLTDRLRRQRGEPSRQRMGRVHQFGIVNDLIDETGGERRLRVHRIAQKQHRAGSLMAEQLREQQRTSGLRHQAETGERHDEPRRAGGDD